MFNSTVKVNNFIYLATLILSLSGITAAVILYASFKVIVAFSLLPILIIFYLNAPDFAKIVFLMLMITFPITLQALGKDAFSTGTLLIFATLIWSMAKYKLSKTIADDKLIFKFLALIVCIGFVGMITKTPSAYWGPAIRHYVNLISSIAVFILIVHSQNIAGITRSNNEYIEKIINTLLLITILHVFLSLLILNYPSIEKYLTIFLNRGQEQLGGHLRDGIYERATSVFTRGEEFGELLILLYPFSLYKIFISRKKIYWVVVSSFILGILLSGTRSAFLLIIFQSLAFFYILVPAKYNNRKIIITVSFILVCIMMLPVFFKYAPILMDRVQASLDQIVQKDDILTITNRSVVWPLAWDLTKNTISFFGHGPIQAHGLGYPVKNFHNLYLSLIFQFGIIGLIVIFSFFFTLFKRLLLIVKWKREKDKNYLLAITCLLSFSCFLINEFKFEFNRSDSYQQFVWIIFAIYYLTGRLNKYFLNEESNYN